MNHFFIFSVLISLVFVASLCLAEIPKMINYQGMLTDDSGDPITDTLDLQFRIYNAQTSGTLKWSETQPQVPIIDGLFNVILGSVNPSGVNLDFSEDYWLEVQVGSDTMPRIQFTSVGYAYRAMVADTAYATAPSAGSHWTVSDSVLYTNRLWGIARGAAGNLLYGDSVHSHVNLGVRCTTGASGQNYKYCTVGGGRGNTASGAEATVGGGGLNTASGGLATVEGGWSNIASGYCATVGGGVFNTTSGSNATVGGGYSNTASAPSATVGGGFDNTASGYIATVAGGILNTASGNYSFAAGRKAKANHAGTFVWADSTDADFASTGNNQFLIRASGGVGIGTNSPDEKLHVENATGDNSVKVSSADGYTSSLKLFEGADYGYEFQYAGSEDKLHLWSRKFAGNEGIRMTWLKNGNVGIGTTNPNYKLDVDGDINVAGSYNVKKGGANYNHPDYVFEPDYELMPLDELKKYVRENKCLPNVISAEDVKKNEGFKMDELLIQVLEKIEEQTLYIIQLEERIAKLEKER